MNFKVTRELAFPQSTVTSKLFFTGRSGSGKSYGSGVWVEKLLGNGAQVIIIDPVGIWWGLRLKADGKTPAFKLPIFGGQKADVPLNSSAGKLMAEILVRKQTSAILDVSEFDSMAETRRFITDFAVSFFHLKKHYKSPVMVVWEECQDFVPQFVRGESAKMVGAMERLIKIGRNYGVGTTLISQRPQAVNKDVLNQSEVLIAFQTTGPQERKTLRGWIVDQGLEKNTTVEEAYDHLPSLKTGQAFVWSPSEMSVFMKVSFLKKKTFDSSATPKFGSKVEKSRELAPVDIATISKEMADLVEEAKENDPVLLKREMAALKEKMRDLEKELAMAKSKKDKGRPVIKDAQIKRVERALAKATKLAQELSVVASKFSVNVEAISSAAAPVERPAAPSSSVTIPARLAKHLAGQTPYAPLRPGLSKENQRLKEILEKPAQTNGHHAPQRMKPTVTSEGVKIGGKMLTMLQVLSAYTNEWLSREALAIYTVMSQSGTFTDYISKLFSAGYIEKQHGGVRITEAGLRFIGGQHPVPERAAIINQWMDNFSGKQKDIFRALVHLGGKPISRSELAAVVEMKESGTFTDYISKIFTTGVMVKERGSVAISPHLIMQ